MNKSLTALLSVLVLTLTLVASPVLAAQVDVTSTNDTTGWNSHNDNDTDIDHDIDVDVENDGEVDNKVDADVNTGDNEQEKNTEAGTTETGGIDVTAEFENMVNEGTSFMGMGDGLEVTADFSNDTTGADSDNDNDLDVDHDIDIDLENDADIFNKLGLYLNTGWNEQYKNTSGGSIATGDIGVDFATTNAANVDSGFAGASFGGLTLDFTGENHLTGADSDNENNVDVDNDVDVDVENDAEIDNKVRVYANTGGNEQKKNTQAGDITTGNVDVAVSTENHANTGSGVAAAGNSGLEVTVDSMNDTTGADSDNENNVDVDNDVNVDIENDAEVTNDFEVEANSGDNEQKKNTEGGDIETGSVTIDISATNVVNSN
jgi:hypothetical protein